jgi:hypothetical protein
VVDLATLAIGGVEKLTHKLDDFDFMARDLDVINKPTPLDKDEYKAYITQNPIHINGLALSWWLVDEQ